MNVGNIEDLLKDDILTIWRGTGYIAINSLLAGHKYPLISTSNMHIEYNDKQYNTREIINKLRSVMIPYYQYRRNNIEKLGREEIKYYRGEEDTILSTYSYIRDTFISVSSNLEDGLSFNGESKRGCKFEISIDPNVLCIETGVENELLLDFGLYWHFLSIRNSLYIISIEIPSEGQKTMDDILHELTTISESKIETSSSRKTKATLDSILENIDYFNIASSEEYSINDFKDDLIALDFDFKESEISDLYSIYLSSV